MHKRLEDITLQLPWVERLDMTNDLAPLAPELALQIEKNEQKRENQFKGNRKIPYVAPDADPVLNDFKREILFYRQAQSAVVEGIPRLKEVGISTKRPDDYFAEMAKSDEQMQKVRKHLIAKQEGQQKSERIKQLRESRKMSKVIQREVLEKKQAEKTKHMTDLKAFRKGKLKNLDFLDDDKDAKSGKRGPIKRGASKKQQAKDKKFGFGGKKKGSKRNDKDSSMETSEFKLNRGGGNKAAGGRGRERPANKNLKNVKRLGKVRRSQGQKSRGK